INNLEETEVTRAKANLNTNIIYNKDKYEVLYIIENSRDFNEYIITDGFCYDKVSEKDLIIEFNNLFIEPEIQMENYEFHNPFFYINRFSPNLINNQLIHSKNGFKDIYGSRIYLLKHQMDTIFKALSMEKIRLVLADEVGLGKTIQAISILKSKMKRTRKINVLIIIPDHLKNQWISELFNKFWIDIKDLPQNKKINVISINKFVNEFDSIKNINYDFVIIDEVHNYLKDENIYNKIEYMSIESTHILLLSATPIQRKMDQFKLLLNLLDPERFNNMSEVNFKKLLLKQDKIRKSVYRIMIDIHEYIEDEFVQENIDIEMEELIEILNDDICNNIYEKILKLEDKESILFYYKKILSYISNYYQIERRIIRHRKKELDASYAERSYTPYEIEYFTDEIVYGKRVKDEMFKMIERIKKIDTLNHEVKTRIIKDLISAQTSSSNALKIKWKYYKKTYFNNISDELFIKYLNLWENQINTQINNIIEIFNDPDIINNKICYLIDYLDQSDPSNNDEKEKIFVVINHKETIKEVKKAVNNCIWSSNCSFYTEDMEIKDKNLAIERFQSDEECKILIADSSACEGKNLQISDKIVHYDLDWSPSSIEQKIGRLDRIGRNKNREVESVVFYELDTLEENVTKIWSDIFKIFDESISGLEIVSKDIDELINKSLLDNIEYGLQNNHEAIKEYVEKMKEYILEEQYYDLAKNLDRKTENEYEELFKKFKDSKEYNLTRSMLRWGDAAGFRPSYTMNNDKIYVFDRYSFSRNIGSMAKVQMNIPNTETIRSHQLTNKKIVGTFERDLAIKQENLVFFSPGEPIFDTIFNNAKNHYKGRTAATKIYADFEWTGFLLAMKIDFDYKSLFDYEIPYEYIRNYKNIVMKPIVLNTFDIEGSIEKIKILDLIKNLENNSNSLDRYTEHLGRRGNGSIDQFKEVYDQHIWTNLIDKAVN
ncbi:MAG: DEAD/DEAH box helicase, partial [Bacillota bacterium]|nr:DEAD/DEAH box helicase [Bacillota bacterium]